MDHSLVQRTQASNPPTHKKKPRGSPGSMHDCSRQDRRLAWPLSTRPAAGGIIHQHGYVGHCDWVGRRRNTLQPMRSTPNHLCLTHLAIIGRGSKLRSPATFVPSLGTQMHWSVQVAQPPLAACRSKLVWRWRGPSAARIMGGQAGPGPAGAPGQPAAAAQGPTGSLTATAW